MIDIDIVTIAFNNLQILQIQHTFLKKYIKNSFNYYIVDNSNTSISKDIEQFCKNNNIYYVKTNSPNLDFSHSHANAIHFALGNLPLTANYILSLDHDIIPITDVNIYDNIKNCLFYGLKQEREEGWYIWPGFFLFKNDKEIKSKLNFTPCTGLDTGGSNYKTIFKDIDNKDITFVSSFYYCSLIKTIENFRNNIHSFYVSPNDIEYNYWHKDNDMFELFDGWVHFINVSNWNKKGNKIPQIIEFTNLFLNKDII